MKLSSKLMLITSFIVLLASLVNLSIVYYQNKKMLELNGQQNALAIIKTFESRLSQDATTKQLQQAIDALGNVTELNIHEFNLYKIGEKETVAIASLDEENIGKQADPEDIEAAQKDETVPIIEDNIVDITAPLHVDGKIVYVAGVQFSIQNDLKSELTDLILAGAATLAVALILLLYISKRFINRPLQLLLGMSQAVTSGDLTGDYSGIDLSKKDEIGMLTASFVHMAQNSNKLIWRLSDMSRQLASSSVELEAIAKKSAGAASQTSNAVQDIASGSETQLQGAEQTSQAMEEMAAGIQKIAESSSVVSDVAIDASNKVRDGYGEVNLAIRQMGLIREVTDHSSQAIDEMHRNSEEIGQFVQLISDIANQTQILSLNAAIEAARAGEHGKGFAVVAAEVKKLAGQAGEAAASITGLIKEIQGSTKNAVNAMNVGAKEVEKGIVVINKTEEVFRQLSTAIGHVSDQIQEVSAAAEQMSASTEEVSASAQEMLATANNIASSTKEAAFSTSEQHTDMQSICESAESLSNMASEIKKLLDNFKI